MAENKTHAFAGYNGYTEDAIPTYKRPHQVDSKIEVVIPTQEVSDTAPVDTNAPPPQTQP